MCLVGRVFRGRPLVNLHLPQHEIVVEYDELGRQCEKVRMFMKIMWLRNEMDMDLLEITTVKIVVLHHHLLLNRIRILLKQ